jgi:hypothetical protein
MVTQADIERELRYFDSDVQREAFGVARVAPYEYLESWQYSTEQHKCTVIAADGQTQIVYCATGFGPSFPWSIQKDGENDLGMDSEWYAYLYEAFVCSTMWHGGIPYGFVLMGPNERTA